MLENVEPLTLNLLNRSTQAWVELEYNRRYHREINATPLDRMLSEAPVSRPAPSCEQLRIAFCTQAQRRQRRSDGTITIGSIRFEIPSRFRHLQSVTIRYQSWDLSEAYMVDLKTGALLAFLKPIDKTENAHGRRRILQDHCQPSQNTGTSDPIPPLLRQYITDYAATGLPPSYLPLDELKGDHHDC